MPTDWGTYNGRRRKPCPEDPRGWLWLAASTTAACPCCGLIQMVGREHNRIPDNYEADGETWPPGYEPVVITCACGVPQQHLRALIEHWREEHEPAVEV